jgi:hypothetical protein
MTDPMFRVHLVGDSSDGFPALPSLCARLHNGRLDSGETTADQLTQHRTAAEDLVLSRRLGGTNMCFACRSQPDVLA